jgi:hypothetical protein
MTKRAPFTAQEERLERLIRNARSEIVALKGMIDTARSIVTAQYVKVDDPSSPQILRVSEGGTLEMGSESPMRIIGAITEEVSHTGDTNEVTLGTITVPADSMGAHGFLRIAALFRAMGAGTHTFKIKFGGNDVKRTWYAGTTMLIDFVPAFVWNKGAVDSQETGIMWGVSHLRTPETPTSFAVDTSADVDVTFTGQNTVAGDTAYFRFGLVEAFFSD